MPTELTEHEPMVGEEGPDVADFLATLRGHAETAKKAFGSNDKKTIATLRKAMVDEVYGFFEDFER